MPLTPEEEKKIREEIRKQLEEQEKRLRAGKEQEDLQRRTRLEQQIREKIKQEEEERFFTEKGYVKYINRYGETEWLTPEEAERRQNRIRSRKTSSRHKQHKRKRLIRLGVNLGIVLGALFAFAIIYKLNPGKTPKFGKLVVRTNVPGAAIFLDGEKTNFFAPDTFLRIGAGTHYVSVYKDGFSVSPPMRRIYISRNKTTEVQFEMKSISYFGKVKLNTNLKNYRVFLDGLPYDMKNGNELEVPVGYHVISLVKEGFLASPPHRRIVLEKDEVRELSFQFNPAAEVGYLHISSNNGAGFVYLDNKFSGIRPVGVPFPVRAGVYEIKVCSNGFRAEPLSRIVNLVPGQTQLFVFRMEPEQLNHTFDIFTKSAGLSILLDGELLPVATPAIRVPISPGEHFINFLKDDSLLARDDLVFNTRQLRDDRLEFDF